MTEKVFITYDYAIRDDVRGRLARLLENADFMVSYLNTVPGMSQAESWRDIVRAQIEWADRVVTFVNLPNVNLGFQVGYALGLAGEKAVALVRIRKELPEWLEHPPFTAFNCPQVYDAPKLLDLVRAQDWLRVPHRLVQGAGVLLLCPPKSGFAYAALLKETYPQWQTLPAHGWTIQDLPDKFQGIGDVVWLVVPHLGDKSGHDGHENATASVVAGFAAGLGLPIHVFVHRDSRIVVDVAGPVRLFDGVGQLMKLIEMRAPWPAATPTTIDINPTPHDAQRSGVKPTGPKGEPLKVFISYSHRDERMREHLGRHLAAMETQGLIRIWHDRKIEPAADWDGEINREIEDADVILLLVSASFISSSYCQKELQNALNRRDENKSRPVPIILRPCDWESVFNLSGYKIQALPRDNQSVSGGTWVNQDSAFYAIVRELRRTFESIRGIDKSS